MPYPTSWILRAGALIALLIVVLTPVPVWVVEIVPGGDRELSLLAIGAGSPALLACVGLLALIVLVQVAELRAYARSERAHEPVAADLAWARAGLTALAAVALIVATLPSDTLHARPAGGLALAWLAAIGVVIAQVSEALAVRRGERGWQPGERDSLPAARLRR